MKHLGDITKINGKEIPIVDVIVGGSPCQDLSVAGKRAGLAGERSGLFMEQMRIVREMRERDRDENGRTGKFIRPNWMVWENVPGAFSSGDPKGADFQAVIEEIVKIVCKEAPAVPIPPQGWPNAGCISGMGDGGVPFSVAWRVHDAQFWGKTVYADGRVLVSGTPQRRRRISLIADFGGLRAGEVLFERKGLSWDTSESGEEGEGTPGSAGRSIEETGTISFQERAGKPGGGKGILIQNERVGALSTLNNQSVFDSSIIHNCKRLSVCETLGERMGAGGGNIPLVTGVANPTLNNQSVLSAVPLDGNGARPSHSGDGYGKPGDPMYTLNGTEQHGVAYDARGNGGGK